MKIGNKAGMGICRASSKAQKWPFQIGGPGRLHGEGDIWTEPGRRQSPQSHCWNLSTVREERAAHSLACTWSQQQPNRNSYRFRGSALVWVRSWDSERLSNKSKVTEHWVSGLGSKAWDTLSMHFSVKYGEDSEESYSWVGEGNKTHRPQFHVCAGIGGHLGTGRTWPFCSWKQSRRKANWNDLEASGIYGFVDPPPPPPLPNLRVGRKLGLRVLYTFSEDSWAILRSCFREHS